MSRGPRRENIGVILVATDGSNRSAKAIRLTGSLATRLSAKVHVLFASESNYAGPWYYLPENAGTDEIRSHGKGVAESAADELRALGVAEVEAHLENGNPAEVILEMAGQLGADLIVMAPQGRKQVDRSLTGHVAEKLMNTSTIPLLLVK